MDLTIIHQGHRHLICNGNAQVGWLTACDLRVRNTGWQPEEMPLGEIGCPTCTRVMIENDA